MPEFLTPPIQKAVSAATLKLRFLKAEVYAEVREIGVGGRRTTGCRRGRSGARIALWSSSSCGGHFGTRVPIRGLRDSKLIPEKKRNELAQKIREHSLGISIAAVDSARIDQINIYHASREAMLLAVQQLQPQPDHPLIDAMTVEHDCAQTKIIHGDALSASIAAASIIAKVERDRMIRELDASYPGYDLGSNKGYSAPKHIAALRSVDPRSCIVSPSRRFGCRPSRKRCWLSCKRKRRRMKLWLRLRTRNRGSDAACRRLYVT